MSPRSTAPGSADPADPGESTGAGLPDLSALPVFGVTRRRLAFLGAALVAAWIVISFARQVGEATAASSRHDRLAEENAALAAHAAALESELDLIQGRSYIVIQAHGYGLGGARDVPFTLAQRPVLPANAPGSAAVRLGAVTVPQTPLESWLSLLLGPSS
ncbi:MAG TPA: hypothetical protein VH723_08520 [Candidatus Limnocylindrales bacterium]|jgi:hypothetical protein